MKARQAEPVKTKHAQGADLRVPEGNRCQRRLLIEDSTNFNGTIPAKACCKRKSLRKHFGNESFRGGSQLGLDGGKIFLEVGVFLEFPDDGQREDATGKNIGGVMPGGLDAVPANQTRMGDDGIVLVGNKIRKDEGEHHGFGGMTAGITE